MAIDDTEEAMPTTKSYDNLGKIVRVAPRSQGTTRGPSPRDAA